MQESKLERDVLQLIARGLDSLDGKLDREKDFKTVQDESKWIIDLMRLFPQMLHYERFLSSLKELSERPSSERIAKLVFYTLSRFYRDIFSPDTFKPAQGK